MAARKSKDETHDPDEPTRLHMTARKGETGRETVARKMVGPYTRHGLIAGEALSRFLSNVDDSHKPGLADYAYAVKDRAEKAATGDISASSELLMAQAVSLDSIYTEFARIALINVGTHTDAAERYMRLALKAQANSRATLEALAKLHQPREQTVRHVHVNEGGQAVIADQFHHHAGGRENGQTADQPYAQSPRGPAMLGHDAQGNGVPVPGDQGAEQVPDARRQGKRRAQGQ